MAHLPARPDLKTEKRGSSPSLNASLSGRPSASWCMVAGSPGGRIARAESTTRRSGSIVPSRSPWAVIVTPLPRSMASCPGFYEADPATGLCIAFGWDGRRGVLGALTARWRNKFALVYEAAASGLGWVLSLLAARRPAVPGSGAGAIASQFCGGAGLADLRVPRSARLVSVSSTRPAQDDARHGASNLPDPAFAAAWSSEPSSTFGPAGEMKNGRQGREPDAQVRGITGNTHACFGRRPRHRRGE